MANMNRPWLYGAANVVKWFEDNNDDSPLFGVFQGKQLLFSYSGDDMDKAIEKLTENVSIGEQSDNQSILSLRLYKTAGKEGFIVEKTPYSQSILFCCTDKEPQVMGGYDRPNFNTRTDKIMQTLDEMKLLLAPVAQRMNDLEERLNDLEDSKPKGIQGAISGLIENPQVQGLLINKLMGLFGMDDTKRIPQAMAGVETTARMDDKRIHDAVERLQAICGNELPVVLELIAKFGEQNRPAFDETVKQLKTLFSN